MTYFKSLLSLTKPGIIMGNVIAGTGGFFLASQGQASVLYYLITMLGIALVIGSACVFNNLLDIDIDGIMARTETRVLVTGEVSKAVAGVWSVFLLFLGFNLLAWFTNPMTLLLGAFGWFMYVVLYTLVTKRRSIHSTLVGSFSGSTPPVMGYTAVTGELNLTALFLFLAFCAWQVPHTYAIAIFRSEDYRRIQIPLLPLVKTYRLAKNHMLFYTVLFMLAIIGMFVIGSIHMVTVVILTCLGGYWLIKIQQGFAGNEHSPETVAWGKQLFIISILVVSLMSLLLSIDFVWDYLFALITA